MPNARFMLLLINLLIVLLSLSASVAFCHCSGPTSASAAVYKDSFNSFPSPFPPVSLPLMTPKRKKSPNTSRKKSFQLKKTFTSKIFLSLEKEKFIYKKEKEPQTLTVCGIYLFIHSHGLCEYYLSAPLVWGAE